MSPSQLSYHWWPSWSLVHGIRVDYLSPTLYLTDLLLVGLLLLNFRQLLKHWRIFAIFAILALLNSYFSVLPVLSLYKWLRFGLLVGLFFYLVANMDRLRHYLVRGLVCAIVWTAGLAIWQFVLQGSTDSWWYWLGERTFSIATPGIAKVSLGEYGQLLRPYATLPHPNALAGWLGLSLILVSYFSKLPKLIIGVATAAMVFTLSRLALAAMVLSSGKWWAVVLVVGLAMFLPGNPDSWQERQSLMLHAIEQIKNYPIFGTGLGASVIASSVNFQPVHNIFLLLLVEVGLPLGLGLLCLCRRLLLLKNNLLFAGLIFIFITGLGDHYWLTLWQNTLILTVFMAVTAVELAGDKTSSILRWRG